MTVTEKAEAPAAPVLELKSGWPKTIRACGDTATLLSGSH